MSPFLMLHENLFGIQAKYSEQVWWFDIGWMLLPPDVLYHYPPQLDKEV